MQIVTSWMEQGIQQGIEQGKRTEAVAIAIEQLTSLFGKLPQPIRDTIATLPSDRLRAMSLALLKFKHLSDLEQWLLG